MRAVPGHVAHRLTGELAKDEDTTGDGSEQETVTVWRASARRIRREHAER